MGSFIPGPLPRLCLGRVGMICVAFFSWHSKYRFSERRDSNICWWRFLFWLLQCFTSMRSRYACTESKFVIVQYKNIYYELVFFLSLFVWVCVKSSLSACISNMCVWLLAVQQCRLMMVWHWGSLFLFFPFFPLLN